MPHTIDSKDIRIGHLKEAEQLQILRQFTGVGLGLGDDRYVIFNNFPNSQVEGLRSLVEQFNNPNVTFESWKVENTVRSNGEGVGVQLWEHIV